MDVDSVELLHNFRKCASIEEFELVLRNERRYIEGPLSLTTLRSHASKTRTTSSMGWVILKLWPTIRCRGTSGSPEAVRGMGPRAGGGLDVCSGSSESGGDGFWGGRRTTLDLK